MNQQQQVCKPMDRLKQPRYSMWWIVMFFIEISAPTKLICKDILSQKLVEVIRRLLRVDIFLYLKSKNPPLALIAFLNCLVEIFPTICNENPSTDEMDAYSKLFPYWFITGRSVYDFDIESIKAFLKKDLKKFYFKHLQISRVITFFFIFIQNIQNILIFFCLR